MTKGNRRLRLTALGLMLLGLWEMLALLQGASAGMGWAFRLTSDQGFGETHATHHPVPHEKVLGTARNAGENLPSLCAGENCAGNGSGTNQAFDMAFLDRPGGDGAKPADDSADDATSEIAPRNIGQNSPPSFTGGGEGNVFANGPFIPGEQLGGGSEGPGGPGLFAFNPGIAPFGPGSNPGGKDTVNCNSSQKPRDSGCKTDSNDGAGSGASGETPQLDFSQPPFSFAVIDTGGDGGTSGASGPGGSDGSGTGTGAPDSSGTGAGQGDGSGGGGPSSLSFALDPPIQLPEPVTVSFFALGLAGTFLLRRRPLRSTG